jgi:acetylornithine deacetylase/succinyl-diaminopimelate desuccinylase-like protein
MLRQAALDRAAAHYVEGAFLADLARLVAVPTESQDASAASHLARYLTDHLRPMLEHMGFVVEVLVNPAPAGPLLLGERIEDPDLPTVLMYGHGDVVRGQDGGWAVGLSPWRVIERDGRIYGRGIADNKGQHAINLAALQVVLAERGRLGFNVKVLIETGEEIGSPGLQELCHNHKDRFAADLLVASDGPRLAADQPTIFLGSRGALNFDLVVELRDGGHHSGNWGGLLANPAVVLAHAIAAIASQDGAIRIPELKPQRIPSAVRRALADVALTSAPDGPAIDPDWGEPGLSAAEKAFAWSSFEVLALTAGNPENPVNAIPPRAVAHCQIRYTVDVDPAKLLPAIRERLAGVGLGRVAVRPTEAALFRATRTDPDHHWVTFAKRSIERTMGRPPVVLPNIGGSLPNDCFAEILGLPTIWVPHSYPGCCQHAPNEHALPAILLEGLMIMTGLFWDLGETSRTFRLLTDALGDRGEPSPADRAMALATPAE